MSEYQYYEFQTIDRSLTDTELKAVKKLSSHGEVSRNQAIFVYDYGDFRYDPIKILTKYFEERDDFLLQLLAGECNVDKKLHQRLREIADNHTNSKKNILKKGSRTASQLLAAAEQLAMEKKEKIKHEKNKAKIAKLDALALQESKIWNEVHNQIQTRSSKGYEQAVKLLMDLKELANHLQTTNQFITKVKKFSKITAAILR